MGGRVGEAGEDRQRKQNNRERRTFACESESYAAMAGFVLEFAGIYLTP